MPSTRWQARTGLGSYRLNPRCTLAAALWSQWRTPEQESARKMSVGYSTRCSRQNRRGWGWACQSAALSSRPTRDGCGLPEVCREARCFKFSCAPIPGDPRLVRQARVGQCPLPQPEIGYRYFARWIMTISSKSRRTSAYDTKRTYRDVGSMFALGVKRTTLPPSEPLHS